MRPGRAETAKVMAGRSPAGKQVRSSHWATYRMQGNRREGRSLQAGNTSGLIPQRRSVHPFLSMGGGSKQGAAREGCKEEQSKETFLAGPVY